MRRVAQGGLFLLSPLLTAKQVATLLGVSEKSVYRWSELGALPSVRLGRAVRFDPAEVQAFIDAGRRGGGEAQR